MYSGVVSILHVFEPLGRSAQKVVQEHPQWPRTGGLLAILQPHVDCVNVVATAGGQCAVYWAEGDCLESYLRTTTGGIVIGVWQRDSQHVACILTHWDGSCIGTGLLGLQEQPQWSSTGPRHNGHSAATCGLRHCSGSSRGHALAMWLRVRTTNCIWGRHQGGGILCWPCGLEADGMLHVLQPLVLPAQSFCKGSTSSPVHVE
jgi:hypothetical protein